MSDKKKLIVKAKSRRYPIFFADYLSELLEEQIGSFLTSQVVIITNTTIELLYLDMIREILTTKGYKPLVIVLPDGEEYKNFDTLNTIYDALLTNNIERNTTLIALGGGVIGDIVGFVAATYQRGVAFIQIPTTLLSQVDSSVGGKTGINHPLGKNMIGAFYQPQAVFIGHDVLETLPKREFSAGMAEVIKYALLGDYTFFQWLEDNTYLIKTLDNKAILHIIHTCCAMKADIVAKDEKEGGMRALLNLGHTFGHVIEVEMGFGHWLHGEAVAVGLVLASELSKNYANVRPEDILRIKKLLKDFNLPTEPPMIPIENWLRAFKRDKKVKDGVVRFVTLQSLGYAVINDCVTEEDLRGILNEYQSS
ncbi:MAG: 3-dehydroquinate synthase [Neisseriaceae bacterium]|nr:MAG: 3-dehydroquinate synthase [Neisseriaceae bacterium]